MRKGKLSRVLAIFLSAAMTATALAGCGNGGNSVESKAADKNEESSSEPVTLKVVDWESDEMNAAIQESFDNVFAKDHPNIKVQVVKGSYSDWGQELQTMITAGQAPDVFQGGYDMAASFYQKKLLTDWTDQFNQDKGLADSFYTGILNGWQIGGKTFGFPSLVNVYGVFYNKDLLKKAGLKEPGADWIWDDLWDMAKKLADPSAKKYGLYGFDTSIFGLANISVANGGVSFMDNIIETKKATVDDELMKQIDNIKGLIADGVIPSRTYDASNQQSMFEAGSIPLLYYGQWEIDSLVRNKPNFEWGYAPTPKGSSCRATTYDTVGWMSPKDLKYPNETWELIKFMSSDMYKTVLKKTPVAPCANKDAASAFYDAVKENNHPEAVEAVQTMMETETKNGVRFAADWSGDVGKIWDTTYNNYLDGKGNITHEQLQDTLKKVNDTIAAS
jgi:ABC-type glycerol-3-phosphate transport system substrate-binding protein